MTASVMATLARAQGLHQAGQGEAARPFYEAVLLAAPDNEPALIGLGVLAMQRGDAAAAVGLFGRAAAAVPGSALAHFNLGLALLRQNALAEAAAALTTAARLDPKWPEAHYDLGNTRRLMGDTAGAIRAFRQALKLRPAYLQAEVNLANLLLAEGKHEQALAGYRRALAQAPGEPEILTNIGALLVLRDDRAGAEAAFGAALAAAPDFVPALVNLGALAQNNAFTDGGAQAEALLRRALAAIERGPPPADLDGRLRHAECLRLLARTAEAAAIVAALPVTRETQLVRAEILSHGGDPLAALAALPPAPQGYPLVRHARVAATALGETGDLAAAEAMLRAALRQAPGSVPLTHQLGMTLLGQGKYLEGFQRFEARLPLNRPVMPTCPMWTGGAIAGRRLLLVAEEGFGDILQFLRFVPRVVATGARVTLVVPPALLRLCAGQDWAVTLAPTTAPFPPADLFVPLMSVPRALAEAHPTRGEVPYLRADPALGAAWRERLPPGGRRIGLVRSGNPRFLLEHLRRCPAEALAPLAALPDTAWVSLQPMEIAPPPGIALYQPASLLTDFAETAALISALDAVVSTDTGVAHLAGALGKPVFLLGRFGLDWRWWPTPEPPWYPRTVVCRQKAPGDWDGAVAAVCERLRG